jgi:hypothetical protein
MPKLKADYTRVDPLGKKNAAASMASRRMEDLLEPAAVDHARRMNPLGHAGSVGQQMPHHGRTPAFLRGHQLVGAQLVVGRGVEVD